MTCRPTIRDALRGLCLLPIYTHVEYINLLHFVPVRTHDKTKLSRWIRGSWTFTVCFRTGGLPKEKKKKTYRKIILFTMGPSSTKPWTWPFNHRIKETVVLRFCNDFVYRSFGGMLPMLRKFWSWYNLFSSNLPSNLLMWNENWGKSHFEWKINGRWCLCGSVLGRIGIGRLFFGTAYGRIESLCRNRINL